MDLFNKKLLEAEIKNYQRVVEQYEVMQKQLMTKIVELYKERKASVRVLNEFNEYIRSLSNNELFVKMLDKAENLRPFQNMVNKEENGEICHAFDDINGIGSTIATAIVNYRNDNGSFGRIEDIKNVNGIGNATFEKVKNYITIK